MAPQHERKKNHITMSLAPFPAQFNTFYHREVKVHYKWLGELQNALQPYGALPNNDKVRRYGRPCGACSRFYCRRLFPSQPFLTPNISMTRNCRRTPLVYSGLANCSRLSQTWSCRYESKNRNPSRGLMTSAQHARDFLRPSSLPHRLDKFSYSAG